MSEATEEEAITLDDVLHSTLSTSGLRQIADALDAVQAAAKANLAQLSSGQVWIVDDAGENQVVAFHCSDADGAEPRICVFGDEDNAPEF